MAKYFYSLVLLLAVAGTALAQTAPNIGFENGTFDNWQLYNGYLDASGVVRVEPCSPIAGTLEILGPEYNNVRDGYGNFPVHSPNGSKYSIRLGNDVIGGNQGPAERVTYTLVVPASGQYSVTFDYAVVLQNPPHPIQEQPRFTAFVYDVTDGIYIDCPSFDFIGSPDLAGFEVAHNSDPSAPIYVHPWSTATIDLKNYHGKTMRLEFTSNHCAPGGHFGYAYLDVEDSSNGSSAITGNAYCTGQNFVTISGPTGFAQYNWYNADFTKLLGTGQNLTISPPPADQTGYSLQVLPYSGLGCVDTLQTVVNKINANYNFKVTDTLYGCANGSVDLTAPSVVAGSDADLTYSYYEDSLATTYQTNPNQIADSRTYYIKATNPEGCSSVLPVYVSLGAPVQKIDNPAPVTYPQTVDLTADFTHISALTYGYYEDAAMKTPVADPAHIKKTGTYYISISSGLGCTSVDAVNVVVYPPPPYVISAPNTFTPNGDGINDLFKFSISGYLEFRSVRIFTRSGQQIFITKNIDQAWDGTYNGKQVPDGVYYWVFEGEDSFADVQVNKGGSITVIR